MSTQLPQLDGRILLRNAGLETDLTADPAAGNTEGFDNGGRGRFNAWFFDAFDSYIADVSKRHKDEAFESITKSVASPRSETSTP